MNHLFIGKICLLPLQVVHFDALTEAGSDVAIWEFHPENRADKAIHLSFLIKVMDGMANGNQIAFTVFDLIEERIIGLARLFHIEREHQSVEIGTWIHPSYWGKGYNTDIKLALLTYSFETLDMKRVQFRTDVLNLRSQMALQKLGAHLEGCLRKERTRWTGQKRDVFIYSILDEEWPEVKLRLLARKKGYLFGYQATVS